jgi:hypothetical protein
LAADMSMTAPRHPAASGTRKYEALCHFTACFTFRTWRAFFRLISFN